MIILWPAAAHAPLGADDHCSAHDHRDYSPGFAFATVRGFPRGLRVSRGEPQRLTYVSGNPASRSGSIAEGAVVLTPGTLLRLDGVRGYFFCDGQTHTIHTYRLCVLDGPFAGYCVEASDALDDDHVTHDADPVETLDGVPLEAIRAS